MNAVVTPATGLGGIPLADPNVAFVLLVLGLAGFAFELIHPNVLSGILGAIALILAAIGFEGLPVNVGGLLLVAFAFALLIADAFVMSHGLLSAAGLVAFVLGATSLYTPPGDGSPALAVAVPLIAVMVLAAAGLMAAVSFFALRTRHLRGTPGTVGIEPVPVGTLAEVRRPLTPTGSVYAGGEEWSARSADGSTLERGTAVTVVARDDLTLVVEQTQGNRRVEADR